MSVQDPIPPASCAVGLDVGGTKIAGGVVTPSGEVLFRRQIATRPQRGGDAVLADALNLAQALMAEAGNYRVQGIGIGVAELVDLEGNIVSAQTIAWRGLPIRERFARLAPAVVEADVRAAALAEAQFGAGRGFGLFLYVTVGTGISSCLVQAGRPFTGARGSAGTLASGPMTTLCPACGSVSKSVLEEIASGPALVKRFNVKASSQVTSAAEVLAAAAAGNSTAAQILMEAGEALGSAMGWLVNVLDPEAVIVGGGLGSAAGLYWETLVPATRRHIWSDTHRDLPIHQSALGSDAGLIGAAAKVWF